MIMKNSSLFIAFHKMGEAGRDVDRGESKNGRQIIGTANK